MNLEETLKLLDKLKSVGATQFRDGTFEVTLSDRTIPMVTRSPEPQQAPVPVPKPQPQSYNEENTKKMQALIDLLKMKDEELANTIFPDGA